MKVIVDIKNKTLKMLENERSIFKGEYSADKLELYINKQLENEYPVITGLLSNGRRIGPYTTDSSYGIEQIDGMTYTTAEFTLSKENGFTLSEGLMQVTVWLYTTKNSEVVSKIAIGNITFSVVNTTAFNDGDIIISGDVEGTVVNLKVEVENLQSRLEQYLPLSGAKAMTGDLNMDDHDIKNVSTIGVDGTITTATKLLVHDENDDVIPNSGSNYNASFYHASGIRFTTAQEQSAYNLYYPKETGTFVVRNDSGGIKDITKIIDPYDNNGIVFGLLNDETTLYNPDSTIGLSSTEMMNEGDIIHSLKFPDTSETTGDGSWNRYTWNLPNKSGELALNEDIPTKTSQLENDFGNLRISGEDNQIFIKRPDGGPAYSWMLRSSDGGFGYEKNKPTIISNYSDNYNLALRSRGDSNVFTFPKKDGVIALVADVPTKMSQLTNDSGYTTHADLNNVIEIAQGKTKTYVIEASANSFLETTSQEALSLSNTLNLTTVDGKKVPFTDLIKGDVILITDTNLPDRFVGSIGEQVTFYPLESRKMDLDEYALKTEIPTKISQLEQDVELGVSEEDVMDIIESNAEQTNTLAIGTSETFDATSDDQIPTSKAVSDLMASAGGGSKLYSHRSKFIIYYNNQDIHCFAYTVTNSAEPFDKTTFTNYLSNINSSIGVSSTVAHYNNCFYMCSNVYNSSGTLYGSIYGKEFSLNEENVISIKGIRSSSSSVSQFEDYVAEL